jgi:small basic protein
MREFLGVVLGVAIGVGLPSVRSRHLRAALLVAAVLLAGVVTSAVNGELGTGLWAVFVSFDTLLAGLGVALGLALGRLRVASRLWALADRNRHG